VPQVEQLLEKYPNDLKVVFKNFPIRTHKFAIQAALAALAAGRQNKFWEFHDELFKNYNLLNDEKVQELLPSSASIKKSLKKIKRAPSRRPGYGRITRKGSSWGSEVHRRYS